MLSGHVASITSLAFASDGKYLFSISGDGELRSWHMRAHPLGKPAGQFMFDATHITASPTPKTLAIYSDRECVLWNYTTSTVLRTYNIENDATCLRFSPSRTYFATLSDDAVCIYSAKTGRLKRTLRTQGELRTFAWSPTSRVLAAATSDNVIHLWDAQKGTHLITIEGHSRPISSLQFAVSGNLLISQSQESIRFWRCSDWVQVGLVDPQSETDTQSISVHPRQDLLAVRGDDGRGPLLAVWQYSPKELLRAVPPREAFHYRNAKVVLVGDSGVGKSALGIVLAGHEYKPTDSTHGRRVWNFDYEEKTLSRGHRETRETLLWDLAGQSGYRLTHQLHLNEVAVAVVVFDAKSEVDPFAGVRHWVKALEQARGLQAKSAISMRKILVVARCDRGGISVSDERVKKLMERYEFDQCIETSAREGTGVTELADAIRSSIQWKDLPKVSSTELFHVIKRFLVETRSEDVILATVDELFRKFKRDHGDATDRNDLPDVFRTCISRVENRGLIRLLSFGDIVLLQPDVLDAYASAVVNEARNEPDGLGFIPEEDVLSGRFAMSDDARIPEKDERLLLIGLVEELIEHEVVLREKSDGGVHLVFPSQFRKESPDFTEPHRVTVAFEFEGPIDNVYASLAVRLAHSMSFSRHEMWKSAATYIARVSGLCGIERTDLDEGRAELGVFFDGEASEETQFQFEDFVAAHLNRTAVEGSVRRRRIFRCGACGEELTATQVSRRLERGFEESQCPVCDTMVSLLDGKDRVETKRGTPDWVKEMDKAADEGRVREANQLNLAGRQAIGDYDVFFCYNSDNRTEVDRIARECRNALILPWIDHQALRPGSDWQSVIETVLMRIPAVAVFIGPDGVGPWQDKEVRTVLQRFANRSDPIVVPVILHDVEGTPKLPPFLSQYQWVDFRKTKDDPMKRLLWGITGKRGELES